MQTLTESEYEDLTEKAKQAAALEQENAALRQRLDRARNDVTRIALEVNALKNALSLPKLENRK